jgi:hypothetical protein
MLTLAAIALAFAMLGQDPAAAADQSTQVGQQKISQQQREDALQLKMLSANDLGSTITQDVGKMDVSQGLPPEKEARSVLLAVSVLIGLSITALLLLTRNKTFLRW